MSLHICSDIVETSEFSPKSCMYEKPVNISNIKTIFSDQCMQCTTDVVYLNKFDKPKFVSEVYVTHMSDDEYCTFHISEKYIYVYGAGLLENMLVWSDIKKSRLGYLGTHVSIGLKNNMLDVHTTLYKVKKTDENKDIIATTSTKVYYSVRNTNKLMRISGGIHQGDLAKVVWDEILCVLKKGKYNGKFSRLFETEEHRGGGKSKSLHSESSFRPDPNLVTKKLKTMYSLLDHEYEREIVEKKSLETIKQQLVDIYELIERNKNNQHQKPYGLVSISYVPKNQYKSFAKKLQSLLHDTYQTVLLSDHHTKLSVLMVNVLE